MTILVTGGAGYIGSHVVLELLKSGHSVLVIDDCSNAVILDTDPLPEPLKRVQSLTGQKLIGFHQIDLKKYEDLRPIFAKHTITSVIHLAAHKAVGESCRLPLMYYENNVMSAINLLKCMKESAVGHFIFSSSATVYGVPQYLPIDENHATGQRMTNPYGRSKYFVEEILKDEVTARGGDLSVISLRYFNPVGAHESGEIGEDPKGIPNNLVPFISQVAVGRRPHLNVFGHDYDTPDGTGVRDYIHITDLALGHVAALDRILVQQNLGFEAINLGSGSGQSVLQIVAAFEKACGKKIDYKLVDRREGDVDSIFADCQKANEILHWSVKLDLDRMCTDTWRWQSKYPNGFSSDNDNNMKGKE